jgi:hypothetical protein
MALVFVFGAAGVTFAAAQQSQPGEALYALRAWSTRILHQQDQTQIQDVPVQQMIQTRSGMHERESLQKALDAATSNPCDQPGLATQCGSNQGIGGDHTNEHPEQDHNRSHHGDDGTGHRSEGSGHDCP